MKKNSLNSGSRKANSPVEIIVIIIVMVVFSIVSVISYRAFAPINTQIQANAQFPNVTKQIMNQGTTRYPATFDDLVLFGFIALSIAAIGFAFIVDTSPLFFMIAVVLLVFGGIGIAALANSSINVLNGVGIGTDFPKTLWILHHLLELYLVIGLLITGVLYGKTR